jgi:DNA-damage-inducible protein J
MPKTAMVRARTDSRLKAQVEGIFDELGLNTTSAINIFYKQVVLNHGLPFEVKKPNAATRKAMKDAKTGKTVKGFKSTDDMFRSLKA